MEIKEINTSDIQTIFSWKYPTPYQQYDMPSLEVAKEQGYAILDPAKQHVFHTLYREDACVGYFRSYQIGDKTYLGIGLAPSYCGKGIGKEALHEILLYYAKRFEGVVSGSRFPQYTGNQMLSRMWIFTYPAVSKENIRTNYADVSSNAVYFLASSI